MAKQPGTLDALPSQTVSFDPALFENLVKGHGIPFVHFRAMRCPVGLVDRYDGRRPNHDHVGCSNGFVYTKAGNLIATYLSNANQQRKTEIGYVDGATVYVTVQRFYEEPDEEEEVQIAEFDRFYLNNEKIVVPTWELAEANITGRDKLHFPVVHVQDLMDSSGLRYSEGQDFDVVGGYIVWKDGGRRPTFDQEANKGQVYSVRYTYRPYWYVKSIPHQVRVANVDDPLTGERETQRMQQELVLQREYVFEKKDKNEDDLDLASQVKSPAEGSFGPR